MFKRTLIPTALFVFMSLLLLITPKNVDAATRLGTDQKPTVVITQDEVFDEDLFVAGESVEMDGIVLGDLYIAGGNVVINGTVNGDVLAAGGNVTINGVVDQDVRVAGGQVSINSNVGHSVTALGGTITIQNGSQIAGNVVTAGGNVVILSTVSGNINSASGSLSIGGPVKGNVDAAAGSISIPEGGVVEGELTYFAEEPLQFDESKVTGGVTFNLQEKKSPSQGYQGLSDEQIAHSKDVAKDAFRGIFVTMKIIGMLSLLIVGLLFVHLYPKFSKDSAEVVKTQMLKSVGMGFVIFAVTPILFISLLITIIGMPIAMIYLAVFGIAVYISQIPVMMMIGLEVVMKLDKKWHDGWAFVIGLILVSILKMIPVVGMFVSMFATIIGLGALVISKTMLYKTLKKHKQI